MAGYIGSKASVVSSGAERKKVFDITTTTTSLTGCSYTPNQVHVFHNGVRLVDGTDYTATDGSTVTLTTAAQSGDEVVVISYATFQTSDTVSASAGGTFSNAVTIDADGATVLTVDRASSDGTVIGLQKDGSSVGSIGTGNSGDLYIGNDDTGLVFAGGADAVLPFNPATVASRDAAVDLGLSFVRFKNLYLSGGVYLGGTGAANYLDDYEEGGWTPTVTGESGGTMGLSGATGSYVKVGRMVTVNGFVSISSAGSASGTLQFSNLPFTVADTVGSTGIEASGSISFFDNLSTAVNSLTTNAIESTTNLRLFGQTSATQTNNQGITVAQVGSSGSNFRFSCTYFTS